MATLLSLLSLVPLWPIPSQIHSLIITVFSPLLLLVSYGRMRWSHLVPPLALALAGFFYLLGLPSLSWLLNLLAYAFLINAVHQESVQSFFRTYQDRQKETEALAQEAISLSREQQRLLEAGKRISAVSDLNRSIEHIAKSMVKTTHTDQSAIFVLDVKAVGLARLATVYSAENPLYITDRDEITFALDDYPLLQQAIESQQQMLLPESKTNGLNRLYSLWYENRAGPTLIQPLVVQRRPVGALLLGNPVTHRPIFERDARLCQGLSAQIATMVEHSRRYLELEWQAETMATAVQEQTGEPASVPGPAQIEIEKPVIVPDQAIEAEAYLAISEVIGDGVVVSDATGQVRWVNKAAEQILGKAGRMLIGQPLGKIYGEIDSREPFEDLVVAFSRRNQPLPTFFESEERAIQGRLIPWRNDKKEWLGIIAVFRDVTREVKADRARNDFIAALSHELRSPLTAVKGYSELITEGGLDNYEPEQLHVQQIIHSSAERMVEVLDNAIRITAQNRHQVLPRFEQVDAGKIIDDAWRDITPLAQLHQLKLIRDIPPELPSISADPKHLRRILDNLLSNACRFTPPGGQVTLRAGVQLEPADSNSPVSLTNRPLLRLAVIDNGVGIPQVSVKRIFDPFYRVKNHDADAQSGMGMGLAVVKELVELHGGRVWVESTFGEGAIFHVALPLTQNR